MTLDEAYAHCRAIAHKHGANFSVGFRFLPKIKRRAVYAAYAYCRIADDIADEDVVPAATRLERLDAWQRELDAAYAVPRSSSEFLGVPRGSSAKMAAAAEEPEEPRSPRNLTP